jgi:DNA-binding HxlR family transcriptional regulator
MLRTAKQRKELCRSCPIAKAADIIGDPCSLLVLRDLLSEPRRFGHLDESLGMSTRTLTKTLRRLEEQGLIKRKISKSLPPYVEYSITPKGTGLSTVIDAMRTYGKKYL